jgi:hypothetical protein
MAATKAVPMASPLVVIRAGWTAASRAARSAVLSVDPPAVTKAWLTAGLLEDQRAAHWAVHSDEALADSMAECSDAR